MFFIFLSVLTHRQNDILRLVTTKLYFFTVNISSVIMTLYLPYHFVLVFLTLFCCYQNMIQHFLRHKLWWNMICIQASLFAGV